MFSRSLLVRSLPALRTRVCSRSLSSLRLAQAVPNLRRFSVASALRTENPVEPPAARPAPSGTCYIGNLPWSVTAEQLKDAFSYFGKVESVKLLTTDTGLPRGVGFVQFESIAEAVGFVQAHEADPVFVLDRQIHVHHANKTVDGSKPAEPSDTLVLLDLPGESEGEVRSLFGGYGERVLAVRFHKREGAQRNAFIQFRNVDDATEAMDALKYQNGNARVAYARHRQTPAKAYTLTSRLSQHPHD